MNEAKWIDTAYSPSKFCIFLIQCLSTSSWWWTSWPRTVNGECSSLAWWLVTAWVEMRWWLIDNWASSSEQTSSRRGWWELRKKHWSYQGWKQKHWFKLANGWFSFKEACVWGMLDGGEDGKTEEKIYVEWKREPEIGRSREKRRERKDDKEK